MKHFPAQIPFAAVAVLMTVRRIVDFDPGLIRITSRALTCGFALVVYGLQSHKQASPIHKAMGDYLVLTAIGFWLWPAVLGSEMAAYPASVLHGVLFRVAVGLNDPVSFSKPWCRLCWQLPEVN